MKRKTVLYMAMLFAIVFSAGAQTLILPITGVQAEERRTILAFLTMTRGLSNIVDQSANASLAPAGGRPWGTGSNVKQNMAALISRNNATAAIGINVTPYGTGKLASIRSFKSDGSLDSVVDVQYSDPFEFWIKLQQPVNTTRRANGGPVWINYRQGVNRSEAGELIQLWLADLVSMGSQGLRELDNQTEGYEAAMAALRNETPPVLDGNKPPSTWTATMSEILGRLKQPLYAKDDSTSGRGFKLAAWGFSNEAYAEIFSQLYIGAIVKAIPDNYPKNRPALIFDVSATGNGTRIEVIRNHVKDIDKPIGQGSLIVNYASAGEFRRALRANSLRLMDALYKTELEFVRDDAIRSTWLTSAALNDLKTNVAIPNTFIQVKRPPVAPGEIPRGGFYMTRNQITQREWEAVMGSNPSAVKGADLPVHNVSLMEAMEFCNRASLRDGLMPAYDVFYWAGIPQDKDFSFTSAGKNPVKWTETRTLYMGQMARVRTDKYANGYRLPTSDEWEYALTRGACTLLELIEELIDSGEITDYGWFAENSNGRPHPGGQKKPINGFYDMLGNVAEYVFDGFDLESKASGSGFKQGVSAPVRGGDYRRSIYRPKIDLELIDKDWVAVKYNDTLVSDPQRIAENLLPSPTRRELTYKSGFWNTTIEMYIVPGLRIVRPVFDYWAYRSE
jgi:hypothetical protein